MKEIQGSKELWEPEQGLEDPVLRYALSFLSEDAGISSFNENGERLLEWCHQLNIQPIVYERLKNVSDQDVRDEPWFCALRIQSLKIAGACSYRHQTIERVVGAFHQAGIKPILLKGPALGNTVYPNAHWRTSCDIDFLIDPKEWDIANQSMTKLGYQSSPCLNWGYLSFEKSYHPSDNFPESPLVELHLRLNNRAVLSVFSYQELMANAVQISIGNQDVWIPGKIEHFIYLCVHRVGHYPEDRRFVWLLDLYYLGQSFSDKDWRKVLVVAISKEVAAILKLCLADLKKVLKFNPPHSIICSLEKHVASADEASASYLNRRHSKAHDLVNRWLEIPSWTARVSYLWHWIFPPKSYMNASFKSKHAMLQHLERFVNGLRKYLGAG